MRLAFRRWFTLAALQAAEPVVTLELPPAEGNPRNTEGSFERLKEYRTFPGSQAVAR